MDDLIRAVRHDGLQVVASGERLLKALDGKSDKESHVLRKVTERLVQNLKEELERWETKYKKAKAKLTTA